MGITSSLATHVMWPECTEEDKVSTNVVEAVGKQPTVNRGVWEETGLSPRSKPFSIPSEQPIEDKEGLYAVQSSPQAKEKGHKRSDSSLSAIAAFPLPPDRTEAPQIRSTIASAARKKKSLKYHMRKRIVPQFQSGRTFAPIHCYWLAYYRQTKRKMSGWENK